MNRKRFFIALFSIVFFATFISCNSNEERFSQSEIVTSSSSEIDSHEESFISTASPIRASLQTATSTPTLELTPKPTPEPTEEPEVTYIANRNTGKFHYPDCFSVDRMKEHNKRYFTGGREELIDRGYAPCQKCLP